MTQEDGRETSGAGAAPQGAGEAEFSAGAAQPLDRDPREPGEHPPVVESAQREVTLQRSVRYGRVIVGGAVLGAVVAAIAALFFPVEEGAEYTLGQAVGLVAVFGAAVGLGLGAVCALLLGTIVRRRRGSGVAIQSDVR
ncbi:hypothetical protein [Leucobacter massiliensis]|nr:hypothetical protein [Leucobacter massiliensis]